MSTQSKVAFIKWIRAKHPQLYAAAMQADGGENLAGITDTVNKVVNWISDQGIKLGTAYVQGKAALDLVKLNIKRAKSGMLPANSLEEAAYPMPAQSAGFGGIPPWVLYAGIGLIAFMILRR